jgi:hypothetical protein
MAATSTATPLPSRPLKLRLRYLFAASMPPDRPIDESSALIARLCPGLEEPVLSPLDEDCVWSEGAAPEADVAVVERWVGVEAPVGMLVDESVLPAPRL